MNAGERLPLASLPVPSTSLLSDAVFEDPGGAAFLRFEFRRDGVAYRGGFRFENVRAYRFRAEGTARPGMWMGSTTPLPSCWVRSG